MKQKPHIFLADDDEEDRYLLLEAFQTIGVQQVIQFSNGEKLAQHLLSLPEGQHPDLIILDYNMPRLNGIEALMLIKSHPALQAIRVIIYTTSVAEDIKTRALSLGAIGCYVKPSTFNHLTEMAGVFLKLAINKELHCNSKTAS